MLFGSNTWEKRASLTPLQIFLHKQTLTIGVLPHTCRQTHKQSSMHGVAPAHTLGLFRHARQDRLDGWNLLQTDMYQKTMTIPLLLFERRGHHSSFALLLSNWRLTAVVFLLDGIDDNDTATITVPVELLALC